MWKTLDQQGILYWPRAGTDLGIARGSSYLSTDGDIDVHVDMPQKQLLEILKKHLNPAPHLDESSGEMWFTTEVHW